MTNKVEQHTVDADEDDVRLDRWFQRHYPQLNNIRLQKLLRTGQVRVDGKRADGKTRLAAGQIVRVPPLPPAEMRAPKTKQQTVTLTAKQLKAMILYDDDDVVILNKPPGLAVQGGTGITESLDAALHFLQQGKDRPRLVHRLDRETSGVLVIARTLYAATRLTKAFRERDTKKFYLAVLQRCPRPRRAEIDAPLLKLADKKAGGKMVVDPKGDEAQTGYFTLVKAPGGETLTLLMPHTGRTHQLRVHTAHIGCPILGDVLYNPEAGAKGKNEGLHLHAARIIIPHPREGYGFLDVSAPLPEAQAATWQRLGFDTRRDWTQEGEAKTKAEKHKERMK